ncbi:MAG: hypothetical protein U9O96_01045 [Candidatus Thermoplasmatota archaeon]|nr:hypothetical protein [Candidatus Thermoplasmatota archaeon]
MNKKKDEENELENKEPELKNIKVTMAVKNWLDGHGNKGETYDQILRRYLLHEGKHSNLEDKIETCAKENKINKWKIGPNNYRNIAGYIYNIGYENDDVEVTIRKGIMGMGNNWLCYTVNGVTFAKISPQCDSVSVAWLAEIEGKLVWRGPFPLRKSDDFDFRFYNEFSDDIRKAYRLAKSIVNGLGDRYIALVSKITMIEESIRKLQGELKTIKR